MLQSIALLIPTVSGKSATEAIIGIIGNTSCLKIWLEENGVSDLMRITVFSPWSYTESGMYFFIINIRLNPIYTYINLYKLYILTLCKLFWYKMIVQEIKRFVPEIKSFYFLNKSFYFQNNRFIPEQFTQGDIVWWKSKPGST